METKDEKYEIDCNPFKEYVDLFCMTNDYSRDEEPSKTGFFSCSKQSKLLLAVKEVE